MERLPDSLELTLIFDRSAVRPSPEQLMLLDQTLSRVEGVVSVCTRMVWCGSQQMIVVFLADTGTNVMLRKMAHALRTWNHQPTPSPSSDPPQTASGATILLLLPNSSDSTPMKSSLGGRSTPQLIPATTIRQRIREVCYGFLAAGSLGVAWVGLLVPGIPSVPFVLLAAHFALQASPRFRQQLLKSRMFGQMIQDWQEHRAIQRRVKIKASVLTVAILVFSLLIAPPIAAFYVLILFMSAMGLLLISRIPVLPSTEANETSQNLANISQTTPGAA
jgi:hypothetical protein